MIDPRAMFDTPPIPRTDRELLARAQAVKTACGHIPDGIWYECFMRSTHSAEFLRALTHIQPGPTEGTYR